MSIAEPTGQKLFHEVAEHCVELLRQAGVGLSEPGHLDWDEFAELSRLVHGSFQVPATTFTPMMRRLLFAISACLQPRTIVGAGTYVGYTFAWLLRNRADARSGMPAVEAIGIDVDADANRIARANCTLLNHGDGVRFVDGDACAVLRELREPVDLLYIDIDSADDRKMGYRDVLVAALPVLRPGSLVLAHDACLPFFADAFAVYDAFVHESADLAGPWTLPVDACGLSVTAVR